MEREARDELLQSCECCIGRGGSLIREKHRRYCAWKEEEVVLKTVGL